MATGQCRFGPVLLSVVKLVSYHKLFEHVSLVGLGRFGIFKFGSVFNLKYSVSFFSVSVFAHHHNARVSQSMKTLRLS